jgi:hypothetical protein
VYFPFLGLVDFSGQRVFFVQSDSVRARGIEYWYTHTYSSPGIPFLEIKMETCSHGGAGGNNKDLESSGDSPKKDI